jgi:microcystin-dependent protein
MPWSGGIYRKANYATNGWTGDASNNIGIEAGRHDNQDDDFMTGINACLNKAGQNSPTANLPMGGYKHTGCADATANDQYATYGQLSTGVSGVSTPTGIISMYGGAINPPTTNPPSGWLYCNGAAYSRTSYAALFAVIGTAYGAGDGTTTFNVPDMQQRFPLGKAASGTGATLGGTGGAIDHTHTSAAHSHTVYAHTHAHSLTAAGQTFTGTGAVAGTVGGSDGTHGHTTVEGRDSDSGATPIDNIRTTGGGATLFSSATLIRDTGSGHGHGHSLTATITHTHAASSVTGTIGAGSRNGNTDVATSSDTPGVTGGNNPPYIVVNFIIKA